MPDLPRWGGPQPRCAGKRRERTTGRSPERTWRPSKPPRNQPSSPELLRGRTGARWRCRSCSGTRLNETARAPAPKRTRIAEGRPPQDGGAGHSVMLGRSQPSDTTAPSRHRSRHDAPPSLPPMISSRTSGPAACFGGVARSGPEVGPPPDGAFVPEIGCQIVVATITARLCCHCTTDRGGRCS